MTAKTNHGTGIEWTHVPGYKGETWNPVRGCTKISPGCKHCYAETFAERWRGLPGHPYEQGFDLRLVPEKLAEPLHATKPRAYFVNSMSDLHQDGVPYEFVRHTYAVMQVARKHLFMVLTKRPLNMAIAVSAMRTDDTHVRVDGNLIAPYRSTCETVPPNVWLGVSVEDRKHGLPRVDILRTIPAAVRFLSVEPLLEDLGDIDLTGIHWVIVGGESGGVARECYVRWLERVVEQCKAQGVPVFVKQLGSNAIATGPLEVPLQQFHDIDAQGGWGELHHIRVRTTSRKGEAWDDLPPDLRIREFPKVVPPCA